MNTGTRKSVTSFLRARWKQLAMRNGAYVLAPLLSLAFMGASAAYQARKPCRKVDIDVVYNRDNYFIDVNAVKKMIGVDYKILGATANEIDLRALENTLNDANYVEKANAWISHRGELRVWTRLRTPVARVVDFRNNSCYLDKERRKMPHTTFYSARTPIVRGNFIENLATPDTLSDSLLARVWPLLTYVHEDPFWRAQVAELVVAADTSVSITPQLGDLRIDFGKPDSIPQKFARLEAFYHNVTPRVGWDYYREVSVRYHNQIVARRRAAR